MSSFFAPNRFDHAAYASGLYYPLTMEAGSLVSAAGSAPGANSIRGYPFSISTPVTVAEMGAEVQIIHAANNFQCAIYAHNPATGLSTGSELFKTASISTAVAGVITDNLTDFLLSPGYYWAYINNSGATAAFRSPTLTGYGAAARIGHATIANANLAPLYSTPVAFGTWGDLTSAVWTILAGSTAAIVTIKAA